MSNCRQQPGCRNDLSVRLLGTRGRAEIWPSGPRVRIRDDGGTWHYDGPKNAMYQAEHDAFFASIRSGHPINNGDYMARSTLLAIMGRMAAYTGRGSDVGHGHEFRRIARPLGLSWDAPPPRSEVAVPGVTKFG